MSEPSFSGQSGNLIPSTSRANPLLTTAQIAFAKALGDALANRWAHEAASPQSHDVPYCPIHPSERRPDRNSQGG